MAHFYTTTQHINIHKNYNFKILYYYWITENKNNQISINI
jgi:hypothetical protein